MNAKQVLDRFRVRGEQEVEDRAWEIVRTAYQQREPTARHKSLRRPFGVALATVLIGGGCALTSGSNRRAPR